MKNTAPYDEAVVLSPQWLTELLGAKYSGAVVTGTEVVERLETVATKVRFRVEYAEPTDAPTALCAKGYFNPALRRGTRTEADFYSLVAHHLPLRTPPCVHAAVDEDTGHALVVMHDLVAAGAHFLDPRVGYGAEQAAATLDQLAALHAATWNGKLPVLEGNFPPRPVSLSKYLTVDQLQSQLDDGRAQAISTKTHSADRLIAAMGTIGALSQEAGTCLVHGDLHTGNIYQFPDGSPGLIDWQVVQHGVWALDVAYHLATVLHPDDLAEHERELVDRYRDRLAAHGVTPPDRDRAWWLYRALLPYGLFMWAITRAVDRPIIEHLTDRLARAVERHRSLDLLGV
ncbi:phosphotransferase [Nocardia macrotermitis]|uniref:CHK kinase-like domain-containing protein n=1 Tax=Nocardia macrotermitis TaxID=2585198 RepID=A0A7K0DEB8_9NOCA|nr:phosphotransferase [Nocardia macrotermitis]MQY24140.1 hypothetical protein [Nocardia macrotermitis]